MDKYLVIGNPIEHSKSPFIHQQFAQASNQVISYGKKKLELEEFASFIKMFQRDGGKGCNITVPFKEVAFKLADELSDRAKAAGAVNTLILNEDGSIIGDNTDGQGLVGDLQNHQVEITNQRILIIGAGGAARGCILPLAKLKPKEIVICNRTVEKAQQIVTDLDSHIDIPLSSCALSDVSGTFDVIINSTSASLSNHLPAICSEVIGSAKCCYDMAYGDSETCFMIWAKDLGVKQTIDGLGMLVGQAAESFRLWRNVTPATEDILQTIRSQL
ncbi:shikimate dehydrogenase [Psychrobium sp. 1_MG-2023]|uniref:shikimate dehydrogenase n=1 Tax=Psychrobium sp. 1_MG-2023 TaxID=3062624 RepID=UPI000C33F0A9|nr:shikimate dehydrogenase [Psychrobium sp. 1_MG-2023]MDP2560985.1 shikimate dehydrogenase [Psychrobium sp. 1_MG-2023]PKF58279.1 shikimate dehydrogenase [Alteromonadales bacterium alter-6D02]